MKVIVTSDLHYDMPKSRGPTHWIAERICRIEADALIIAGDTCGPDPAMLDEALGLFEPFGGRRMLVAGNHCLWVQNGQSSLDRYERELAEVAQRHGFDYLDAGPVVLDKVGVVGNVGWYDYSFACADLAIPRRFYERKVAPGAAAVLPEHHDLFDRSDDLRDVHVRIHSRWMDGVYVKLGCSDPEFTTRLVEKMRRHLQAVRDRVDEIVVVMHHLPFAELVVRRHQPNWDFANAFMGSERFGQVMLGEPKVRYCLCGHTHVRAAATRGHVTCMSIGSTYQTKRYEIIEVGTDTAA